MSKNILVIGDSILDETVISDVIGTSLETPTLKTEYKSSQISFGGASNVVSHMLSLDANVTFLTILGNDSYLTYYENFVSDKLRLFYEIQNIQNTVKTRYWVQSNNSCYKYLQMNRGQKINNEDSALKVLLSKINIETCYDCIVLVDYSRGLLDNSKNIDTIMNTLKTFKCPIIVSSQLSSNTNNYPLFKGVDYMCMNDVEALANYKDFTPTSDGIKSLAKLLQSNICVTLGKEGFIFYNNQDIIKYDGFAVDAIDTCGAGDAFLAAFAVFMNQDLDRCNKWAALSTTKLGTETPTLNELYE
tara:strand:- start:419 stop:1324 length:906 start_codon:yes stop_codon:yes gene_type:complete